MIDYIEVQKLVSALEKYTDEEYHPLKNCNSFKELVRLAEVGEHYEALDCGLLPEGVLCG